VKRALAASLAGPATSDWLEVGSDDFAGVGGVGAEVPGGAGGVGHRADDVVIVDVVRPDDYALTEPVAKMGDQVGESVASEASSEMEPHAVDLKVEVAPG
jgi:hypothetical protein